jgi:hypothetical protein
MQTSVTSQLSNNNRGLIDHAAHPTDLRMPTCSAIFFGRERREVHLFLRLR